jgi:hypothetical protein
MLKLLFTSFIFLFFSACSPSSSIILYEGEKPKELDKSTILKIPIPVREHGYNNFDTQVLTTQRELDTFISNVKKEKSWEKKENFISSLTLHPIEFKKYNILLYRMTESSGSTVLAVDVPKGTNEHIYIEIGRDKPHTETTDMAYYALAYKVAKSVKNITFDNGLKKHVIKNKFLNIQKNTEVPKTCLEWYDGCNDCGRVGDDGDIVCTERYCIQNNKFKCTKWDKNHENIETKLPKPIKTPKS